MSQEQLSLEAEVLLHNLIVTAKSWGWEEDQGTGRRVIDAERNFNKAVEDMKQYLLRCEPRS